MRCLAPLLLAACTADRTLSEQPPFQCHGMDTWWFARDDESHCVVSHSAFFSCDISSIHGYGTAAATEVATPACDATASALPCWRADDTVAACMGLQITIDRDVPPAPEDAILGWCLTCD